jgi:processive 1,2-diacylglycerol beta-glucosyltransferase
VQSKEVRVVQLFDKETGSALGSITDDQFQFMMDQLVEESEEDTDYYFNEATLELFEEEGADAELLSILRRALGGREEMEIRWAKS